MVGRQWMPRPRNRARILQETSSLLDLLLCLPLKRVRTTSKWISHAITVTNNVVHDRSFIGAQPARRERRKEKNRQLRDPNPGCLTVATINHWATKPPQQPAIPILFLMWSTFENTDRHVSIKHFVLNDLTFSLRHSCISCMYITCQPHELQLPVTL